MNEKPNSYEFQKKGIDRRLRLKKLVREEL